MKKSISSKIVTVLITVGVISSMFASAVAAATGGVRGYVERLYSIVLQREGEEEGITSWVNAMNSGTSAAECAAGFFGSDEFRSRELSTDEYLDILYMAILGREADEAGKEAWGSLIEQGYPRNQVLADFIGSDEFTRICETYNVTRGSYAVTDILDTNYRIAEFVKRAYRLILGREADEAGLRGWVSDLALGRVTAAVMIKGFLDSPEFQSLNISNREYVEILYNTLLSRAGDEAGIENWLGFLDQNGVSRNYVLKGFVDSDEFSRLCSSYDLPKGTIDLTEPRDWNPSRNTFIMDSYMAVYGRMPTIDELNAWARDFAGGKAAKNLLNALFESIDLASADRETAVDEVYTACLGRHPSEEELSLWTSYIRTNGFSGFLDSIYNSAEFSSYCEGHGIGAIYNVGINNIDNRIYYFDGTSIRSGWQRVDGQRYYFDPDNGYAAVTGWKYIDGLRYYFNGNGTLCQDVDSIIGPQSEYYLTVNTQTNTIMVYARSTPGGAFDTPVRCMICSCGVGGATIHGDFTVERLGRWRELMGPCYGQYCSRITGNYLFHSAWYYNNGDIMSLSVREFNRLGTNASHGCVRLTVLDAKWIWEHCNGSRVHLFASGDGAPFDRPAPYPAVAVNGDYGYDPRDPSITG